MDDKSKLDRIREAIQSRDRFLEGHPELKAFQEEIDKKIETLSKLRNEIRSQMDRKETIAKQKIKHLIKAYNMLFFNLFRSTSANEVA